MDQGGFSPGLRYRSRSRSSSQHGSSPLHAASMASSSQDGGADGSDSGFDSDATSTTNIMLPQYAASSDGNRDVDSSDAAFHADESDENMSPASPRPVPVDGGMSPALASAFTWASSVAKQLHILFGIEGLRSSMLCHDGSVATQFSGIGCAELSMDIVSTALRTVCGLTMRKPMAWACESNRSCIESLMHRGGDHCVFTDMRDFCQAASTGTEVLDYASLQAQVHASRSPVHGHCARHQSHCQYTDADGFVAGSPCQLWSRFGRHKGRQDARVVLLLGWCHCVRMRQPLWAVHENVASFDTNIIDEELGGQYTTKHMRVNPSDVGFACVHRVRVYTIAFRKDGVVASCDMCDVYRCVANVFQGTSPCAAQLFSATDAQLLTAENHVRCFRRLVPLATTSNDWSYLLTVRQRERFVTYSSLWRNQVGSCPDSDANCVFDLSQNPEHRPRTSSRGSLPCALSGNSLFWSPARKRWMLPVELAAAYGIPSTPVLAGVAMSPSSMHPGQQHRSATACMWPMWACSWQWLWHA